jgi:hypothetical protein
MHTLDEHIHRRRDSVLDRQYSGIVAGTDADVSCQRQPLGNRCNQRKLTYLSQRGFAAPTHPNLLRCGIPALPPNPVA